MVFEGIGARGFCSKGRVIGRCMVLTTVTCEHRTLCWAFRGERPRVNRLTTDKRPVQFVLLLFSVAILI